ncbi:Gm1604b [Phodopus roborovskii]|uniref:Gm1604b protein n=1 Tax=Phodopus roborovskii TaxID=109678 RepID=A0AAV0A9B5_PHORO|nr:Gm1604b [Phodopus roborovskii]
MPIAQLLELWKRIEVEPMEIETTEEELSLDTEPTPEDATEEYTQPGASKNHSCCQLSDCGKINKKSCPQVKHHAVRSSFPAGLVPPSHQPQITHRDAVFYIILLASY